MQFGYVVMFAIAFPLGPVFALLNNVVGKLLMTLTSLEIQVDKYKITHLVRRPRPRGGNSIGNSK